MLCWVRQRTIMWHRRRSSYQVMLKAFIMAPTMASAQGSCRTRTSRQGRILNSYNAGEAVQSQPTNQIMQCTCSTPHACPGSMMGTQVHVYGGGKLMTGWTCQRAKGHVLRIPSGPPMRGTSPERRMLLMTWPATT